jgi:hypothetical protein
VRETEKVEGLGFARAVAVEIGSRKVSWVLDADIRGFFDTIDHEWLVKFIEHRIADRRVVRQIRKWLKAGVLKDGELRYTECGTPRGGKYFTLDGEHLPALRAGSVGRPVASYAHGQGRGHCPIR